MSSHSILVAVGNAFAIPLELCQLRWVQLRRSLVVIAWGLQAVVMSTWLGGAIGADMTEALHQFANRECKALSNAPEERVMSTRAWLRNSIAVAESRTKQLLARSNAIDAALLQLTAVIHRRFTLQPIADRHEQEQLRARLEQVSAERSHAKLDLDRVRTSSAALRERHDQLSGQIAATREIHEQLRDNRQLLATFETPEGRYPEAFGDPADLKVALRAKISELERDLANALGSFPDKPNDMEALEAWFEREIAAPWQKRLERMTELEAAIAEQNRQAARARARLQELSGERHQEQEKDALGAAEEQLQRLAVAREQAVGSVLETAAVVEALHRVSERLAPCIEARGPHASLTGSRN